MIGSARAILFARSMCSSMRWNSVTSGSMASIRQRPAGRCRIHAIEPEATEFKRIHEHIDRANRIALADPIIEAFRQQHRLLAIRPLNETPHHVPRRFSKRIIASMGFSHSLDPKQTSVDDRAKREVAG